MAVVPNPKSEILDAPDKMEILLLPADSTCRFSVGADAPIPTRSVLLARVTVFTPCSHGVREERLIELEAGPEVMVPLLKVSKGATTTAFGPELKTPVVLTYVKGATPTLKLAPFVDTVASPAALMLGVGILRVKSLRLVDVKPAVVPVCVKAMLVCGTVILKVFATVEVAIVTAPKPVSVGAGILIFTLLVPDPLTPERPALLVVVICIKGTSTTKELVTGVVTIALPVPVIVGLSAATV